MNRVVKSTLILMILSMCMTNYGHAFDLDETVDDDIRKNYKTEDENLPALPAITKSQEYSKNQTSSNSTSTAKPATKPPRTTISQPAYKGTVKVKGGTTFEVVSSQAISDWQREGTPVKFTSRTNVYGKNFTIPANTVFSGEVVNSHQPQVSCNGGLVSIRVYSMYHNGHKIPVNAYITRANDKIILFNNIKGERNYLKTTWKKGNWGRTLFSRMMTLTVNLGGEGSTLILSPFPLAYGTICLGLNTLTSPICAFFSKGGHVSIPAGKPFKIKLIDDAFI